MGSTSSFPGAFILGLLIAAGLGFSSFLGGKALLEFKAADRYVSVKGLAERIVDADLVIWPLRFAETGNDLAALYEVMQARRKTVIEFLTSHGIKAENISTNPPDITDFQARKYSNDNRQRQFRYLGASTLTVRSHNIALVRELMGKSSELLKKGIVLTGDDYQVRPDYFFTRLNAVKPDMIREATNNARKAAEQFARDSGSTVGKIRMARQGLFSINDRDRNTPYQKKIRVVTTVDYLLADD